MQTLAGRRRGSGSRGPVGAKARRLTPDPWLRLTSSASIRPIVVGVVGLEMWQ